MNPLPRGRIPDPDCKTRRAVQWLVENPTAPASVAADMFGCYAGAIRTAWCRMFPGVSMRRRAIALANTAAPQPEPMED